MFYYENYLLIIYYLKVSDEEEVNFIKNYIILEKKRDKDKNPEPSLCSLELLFQF